MSIHIGTHVLSMCKLLIKIKFRLIATVELKKYVNLQGTFEIE